MKFEKKRLPGGRDRRLTLTRSAIIAMALMASVLVVVVPRGQVAPAQSGGSGPNPSQRVTAPTSTSVAATFYGSLANTVLSKPIVGMASTPTGTGYWLVASDGGVFSFGDAQYYGSTGGTVLNKPIVGMASTPTGGYWLVASDGGVFSFGRAHYYGSTGGTVLNKPIVGMASTPTGKGYWLVASDGGVFSLGDAQYYGSTGGTALNKPIVGMASTPTGGGYWLVASDGGVFSFGDAHYYGSTGGTALNKPIVGMASTPTSKGYWLVASDGGVFSFGDAQYYGSTGGTALNKPIVGVASGPWVVGYWMAAADGAVFAFAPAPTPSPSLSPTAPTGSISLGSTTPSAPATTLPSTQVLPPTVPSTISTNCSSDATAALNSYFASLADGAIVSFPANACFLVSNSSQSLLLINGRSNVTVYGNGATLLQTSYNGGVCPTTGPGANQYILTIQDNTNLTINDLIVHGPGSCWGEFSEGDVGILINGSAHSSGNNGVLLDQVTIQNTDGDGLDIYPDQATDSGLNSNITFQNGAINWAAYHAIVPEGVNGLTISHNKFNGDGNFMDLEVDTACSSSCYGPSGLPLGVAQWNINIVGNTFTNGVGGLWIEEEQSPCIPAKNWVIQDNVLDSTVNAGIDLFGSASTSCPLDNGLQISHNVATSPGSAPTGEPFWSIFDWSNVTIAGNNITAFDGTPTYYTNTPSVLAAGLCGVSTGSVTANVFNNFAEPFVSAGCFDLPANTPASSGIITCGNTYGLTEPMAPSGGTPPAPAPRTDGTC